MQASQHQLGKSLSWDCSDCVLMNSEWNVFAEQAFSRMKNLNSHLINIYQLQASRQYFVHSTVHV